MIRALKITAFSAAFLAAFLFVFSAILIFRSDQRLDQVLNLPGVIDILREQTAARRVHSRYSPLAGQARAFAQYLNEPVACEGTVLPPPAPPPPPPPRPRVRLRLIGTCCHTLHPELSLALIDQPGVGTRWVWQAGKAGRSVIQQVNNGLVIIDQGDGATNLITDRPPKASLLRASSSN